MAVSYGSSAIGRWRRHLTHRAQSRSGSRTKAGQAGWQIGRGDQTATLPQAGLIRTQGRRTLQPMQNPGNAPMPHRSNLNC